MTRRISQENVARGEIGKEDLINITAGETVTFTVTFIVEDNGQKLAFEGSDTAKVVEQDKGIPAKRRRIHPRPAAGIRALLRRQGLEIVLPSCLFHHI